MKKRKNIDDFNNTYKEMQKTTIDYSIKPYSREKLSQVV